MSTERNQRCAARHPDVSGFGVMRGAFLPRGNRHGLEKVVLPDIATVTSNSSEAAAACHCRLHRSIRPRTGRRSASSSMSRFRCVGVTCCAARPNRERSLQQRRSGVVITTNRPKGPEFPG
jgi:hypothetical protein